MYVFYVCVRMCVYVLKTSLQHVGAQQFVQPLQRVGEMCLIHPTVSLPCCTCGEKKEKKKKKNKNF